jgi:signal transduction histidine kinase
LKIKYNLQSKEKENDLLKKDIELVELHKTQLIYSLIAAFLVIGLIIFLLLTRIQVNKKLKKINIDLKKAKLEAENNEQQILLINKMLRHDITNNLAVVLSALHLYEKDNRKGLLKEAARKCEAGVELIRSLHTMERNKIDASKLININVNRILSNLQHHYKEINITVEGEAAVMADNGLESVFRNLIENAVVHGSADKINVTIQEFKDIFEITVTNNGTQIDEHLKEKIFEENFSSGEKGKTGMGLYIVKENILRYGGSMYVENLVPEGVAFIINLKKS